MTKNGRLKDVEIIENWYPDDTGLMQFNCLSVFMDHTAYPFVAKILGVNHIMLIEGNRYRVELDPRYDREFLKREIEAQAKIHAEE